MKRLMAAIAAAMLAALTAQAEYVRPGITINGGMPTQDGTYPGYTYQSGVFTLTSAGSTYTFSGSDTSGKVRIVAAVNCTINLASDFMLDLRSNSLSNPKAIETSPIALSGNVTVTVNASGSKAANLHGGKYGPGIRVVGGQTVYVTSSSQAYIYAYGGKQAAGIGSGYGDAYCGTIYIRTRLYARGGSEACGIGQGLGGDYHTSGGTIHIDRYTADVTAIGHYPSAAIGMSDSGTGTMTINISAGSVMATQNNGYGAAIGSGYCATGKCNINISGGTIWAKFQGYGGGGAGIGSGGWATAATTVKISGGWINAEGCDMSAGIGGGEGSATPDITISGGTVCARGDPGYSSTMDIGAGTGAKSAGSVVVTGGSVYLVNGKGTLTAADGTPLNCITVPGIYTDSPSVAFTTSAGNYGSNDVYPDDDGYLYLWAPPADYSNIYVNNVQYTADARSGNATAHSVQPPANDNYTVRFNKNDGSGATADQTFKVGETKSLLWKDSELKWSRDGYTFKGWAESATGAVKYSNGQSVKDIASAGATKNLYAIWQADQSTYTVRFNKNDGSGTTKDQTFNVGETKSLLWKDSQLKWSRTGYTFKGWAESATGAVKYSNGQSVKNLASAGATKHLYAVWTADQSTYTVRFNKNDGSGSTKDQTFRAGETKNLLWKDSELKWTRSGYTFKGWAESASGAVKYANGQSVKDIASAGATKNLYAIWASSSAQATYTVRFHKYDGSGATADQVFKVGETKSLLWKDSDLNWSRSGYTFVGWVPWDPDGKNCILCKYVNGEKVKDLGKEGEVVHLYAGWKSSYRYQVCFNRNDGTGATMIQVMPRDKDVGLAWKDSQIGWTRSGYTFKGWAGSASGSVKYANGATVRNLAAAGSTKQLYAVWTKAAAFAACAAPRMAAVPSRAVATDVAAGSSPVVPEWAAGTYYGEGENSSATITVSADGDVMGIVLFEDDTWTIEGTASGLCIEAEVVDETGKSRPMVFWLSLDDDGHVVLESEDGSIRVMN